MEIKIGDESESVSMNDFFKDMEEWEKNRFFLAKFIDDVLFKKKSLLNYRPSYVIVHFWKGFETIWDEIRWAWQRVFKGYDEKVAWSIDSWLDNIMPKVLTELKTNTHGIPMDFFDGMEYGDNYSYTEEQDKLAKSLWVTELEKMILGFETHRKIADIEYDWKDKEEEQKLEKIVDDGMASFVKYYGSLWD